MKYKEHLQAILAIINDYNTPAHSRIAKVQIYTQKHGLNGTK